MGQNETNRPTHGVYQFGSYPRGPHNDSQPYAPGLYWTGEDRFDGH